MSLKSPSVWPAKSQRNSFWQKRGGKPSDLREREYEHPRPKSTAHIEVFCRNSLRQIALHTLGGRLGYFSLLLLGGGEGGVRGWRGGFIENPRGGCLAGEGAGGPRGRESVCGDLGGGAKYFFVRGRNSHQVHEIPWRILTGLSVVESLRFLGNEVPRRIFIISSGAVRAVDWLLSILGSFPQELW